MIAKPSFDPWVAALGKQASVESKLVGDAKQAAQQFEALLIRQFLSNARSTSWLNDQQESESGWREMADDSLAGYLVKVGGLGLTKQVESLLMQAHKRIAEPTDVKKTQDNQASKSPVALNARENSTVNPFETMGAAAKASLSGSF